MGKEYLIKWKKPKNYSCEKMLQKLPSPISKDGFEIYNYSINENGSYFLDNLVDDQVAARAFRMFIDEALSYADIVEITEA